TLVADALVLRALLDRHRQPAGPVVPLDAVAVLEVLRLVLQIVHDDEDVGLRHLVEVAQPGQGRGLVRGDDHRGAPCPGAEGTAAAAAGADEPEWPRVSQLEVSRVNRPSGVSSTYATGMSTAIGKNAIGWTRSHGGSARTDGAK